MQKVYSFFLLALLGLSLAQATTNQVEAPLIITDVSVVPLSGKQFSTTFNLSVTRGVTDWEFGFFMLQVLHKPSYQLSMQICDSLTKQCVPLIFDQQPAPRKLAEVSVPDLTSGHIVILKPASRFNLNKAHSYQLKIDGMRGIPQNISMMPQGAFLIEGGSVIPLKTNSYKSQGYNESAMVSFEQRRVGERWQGKKDISSPIVPLPQKTTYTTGYLQLESQINILNNFGDSPGAFYVMRQLKNDLEHKFAIGRNEQATVKLALYQCDAHPVECEPLKDNQEGYIIDIKPNQIDVYAFAADGLFYAYQSLKQLFYYYGKKLPLQEIIDYPEYPYRGLMLDVSRHFYTTAELKQIIDLMAMQKLNTLHLHLADDEAWRIALGKYPELTKETSVRYQGYKIGPSNLIDADHDISNLSKVNYENAGSHYSGYYTVPVILDLISYANLQAVVIIPEVEMPGHARSLKKALPKLYDFSKPTSYLSVQGYNDNILPVYKYGVDDYFTSTINNITADLANLFSGQFVSNALSHEISLSADEVPVGAYPESLPVNTTSQKFFHQLSDQLPDYKISGWQQLVQNDDGTIGDDVIAPERVGHIWAWLPVNNQSGLSGLKMAQELLEANYPVVADFADFAYLDIRYSQQFNEPGLYWSTAYADTWKTFMLGRQVAPLKAEYKNMQGVEGALWTELISGNDHLWYMLMPKLSAIAEVGWSNPIADNWEEFSQRLGCGKSGFLAYVSDNSKVKYRGYPNGIALELPSGKCSGIK